MKPTVSEAQALAAMGRYFCLGTWLNTALLGGWVLLTRQLQQSGWLLLASILIAAMLTLWCWIGIEAEIEERRRRLGISDRVSDRENEAARMAAERAGWI